MKIVILDGYTLNPGDLDWSELEKFGELAVWDRTADDEIIERAGGAEIILTNKTPLNSETLKTLVGLKYIGVLATGYNVVDIDTAKELGIIVTNIPTYGTSAVAQFTFALILELCHHVGAHDEAVKEGLWAKSLDFCFWNYPLMELYDKTIGIIGFGRIGRAVSNLARAFGMRVLAYDSYRDQSLEDDRLSYAELNEMFSKSDIISLHCPLTEQMKGIINSGTIANMKDGVFIINTSRGPLINEADLAQALKNGKVAGAGVDVVSIEPILPDNPLLGAPNCIITPHIAWASKESRERLFHIAVENIESFLNGNVVNVVNK